MTSPEWEAANEDDSDRFPQPSPHEAPPPLVDPLRSDPALVARYAEAIDNLTFASRPTNADWLDEVTEAVMAVAEEERAPLVAEVERLRRGGKTLGEIIDKQCQMVLDATGLHDWVDEDGDGDWGAIWDHLFVLRNRAESAEAEVERLRAESVESSSLYAQWRDDCAAEVERLRVGLAKVEALARQGLSDDGRNAGWNALHQIRAALADAPAEQRAEGGACADCGHLHTPPDGCTGPPTPSDVWAGVSPDGCDCDAAEGDGRG